MTIGLSSPNGSNIDAILASTLRLVLAVESFEVEALLSLT